MNARCGAKKELLSCHLEYDHEGQHEAIESTESAPWGQRIVSIRWKKVVYNTSCETKTSALDQAFIEQINKPQPTLGEASWYFIGGWREALKQAAKLIAKNPAWCSARANPTYCINEIIHNPKHGLVTLSDEKKDS